jgi:carbon monoxide dehydrogenase subunit G
MTWIESSSSQTITLRAALPRVLDLLRDFATCARLMPGVRSVEQIERDVLHYQLEEFSNGAIAFTPDYRARFDVSEPTHVRWEPEGQHNFRSSGSFRVTPGPVDGELLLTIEVKSAADVEVDPILVAMVEPFAQQSTDQVTEQYLQALKHHLEQSE